MGSVPQEIKHFMVYEGTIFPAINGRGGQKLILHNYNRSNDYNSWHIFSSDPDVPSNLCDQFKYAYFIEKEPILQINKLSILLHTDLTETEFYDRISNV
jgi:hypothetical protein